MKPIRLAVTLAITTAARNEMLPFGIAVVLRRVSSDRRADRMLS